MAFVTERNKTQKLTKEDVKAFEEMILNHLESHLDYLEETRKTTKVSAPFGEEVQFSEEEKKTLSEIIETVKQDFQNAISDLPKLIKKVQENSENKTGSAFLSDFYSNLWEELYQSLDIMQKKYENGNDITDPLKWKLFGFRGELLGCDSVAYKNKVCKSDSEKNEENQKIKKWMPEYYLNYGMTGEGVIEMALSHLQRDSDDGYKETENAFQLVKNPMEGVGNIAEFDPRKGNADVLNELRQKNSTTLKDEDSKGVYKEKHQQAIKLAQNYAGQWLNKMEKTGKKEQAVTFSDLYNAITEINKAVRNDGKNEEDKAKAGSLRGYSLCSVARGSSEEISPVGAFAVPKTVYKTLDTVAYYMNQIRQENDNPSLQKTNAIRLAGFAYYMLVAEHGFGDGNGRTARLFADAILQAFKLPPHIPQDEEMDVVGTIGEPVIVPYTIGNVNVGQEKTRFDCCAEYFLEGITESNNKLKKNEQQAMGVVQTPAHGMQQPEEKSFWGKIWDKICMFWDMLTSCCSTKNTTMIDSNSEIINESGANNKKEIDLLNNSNNLTPAESINNSKMQIENQGLGIGSSFK